jgi:hypothetical protein
MTSTLIHTTTTPTVPAQRRAGGARPSRRTTWVVAVAVALQLVSRRGRYTGLCG